MRSASCSSSFSSGYNSFCAALALLITALVFATPSSAQVSFQPSVHSSPNIPIDIFQADLNGDGKPDLITTQAGSSAISVFLNDGTGNFPAGPSATYLTTGTATSSVVAGDFNEDGRQDIAVGNCGNSPDPPETPVPSSVSILFNQGGGAFGAPVNYTMPACPDSVGRLIAIPNSLFSVVVSYGQSTITILQNNGTGTFTPRTITGPADTILRGASTGDYNGDSRDDVAAVMETPGSSVQQVVIFYQQSDGSFGPATSVYSISARLRAATTVGFNATGRPDLLVPFFSAANNEPPGVIALANQGGGTFSSIKLHVDPQYFMGTKAAEGDLQGTGKHSIILPLTTPVSTATSSIFGAYAIFIPQGTGFIGPFYMAGGSQGSGEAVTVADFNGDKRLDFAVADGEDDSLIVYSNNTSEATCPFFVNAGVHVCAPGSGATVSSPVAIGASASAGNLPIVAMKAYIDGTQVDSTDINTLNAAIAKSPGTHQLAMNAWDINDKVYQTIVNFTVSSSTACSPPTTAGVQICKPLAGSTVSSPVAISAAANGGTANISAMKAYIDNVLVASSSSGTLTGSATEAAGTHKLVVNAWNTAGKLFQSSATFTVH